MKVCILPGVGFHDRIAPNEIYMVKYLKEKLPEYDIEYFNWKHVGYIPPTPKSMNWLSRKVRDFTLEVILDFDSVIAHSFDIVLPKADVYVGHSAGSVLAILQNTPAITFGCPYSLVMQLQTMNTMSGKYLQKYVANRIFPIYNIVNENDILALNINNAENYVYKKGWNPLSAHLDYWYNKEICKLIAKKIVDYTKI